MGRLLDRHAVRRNIGESDGESLGKSCPAEESGTGLSKHAHFSQSVAGSSLWETGLCVDAVVVSEYSSRGHESAVPPGVGALRGAFSGPPQGPRMGTVQGPEWNV